MVSRSRPFEDPNVEAVFDSYPSALREDLLTLRALVFQVADETEAVGALIETLKWGQPAYLPSRRKTGSTIRIDALKNDPDRYAMLFHCQTTLVKDFREIYRDEFVFQGDRALVFSHGRSLPRDALKHCIALALTYHLKPKRTKAGHGGR